MAGSDQIARACIRKQTPKMAKIHEKSGQYYCASCRRGVFVNYKYCPQCGQRLAFKE